MKTENARPDRAKPIWPSDYSQAGHKNHLYDLQTEITLASIIGDAPARGVRRRGGWRAVCWSAGPRAQSAALSHALFPPTASRPRSVEAKQSIQYMTFYTGDLLSENAVCNHIPPIDLYKSKMVYLKGYFHNLQMRYYNWSITTYYASAEGASEK